MSTSVSQNESIKPVAVSNAGLRLLSCQRGFSMVELITVIVIVGIISAIAAPRMFDRGLFDSRGFYDQVISTLRYAQKTAIAQHRFVCVAFTTDSITLTYGATAACGNDLTSLAGQTPYIVTAPNGVLLVGAAGNDFNFDPLGRPSFAGAPLPISVSGYTSSNVCIAAQTGYVYGQAVC